MKTNLNTSWPSGNNRGLASSQILLLLAAALMILFFGYRQYDRHFGREEVLVAKVDLVGGEPVAEADVETKRLARSKIPADAIRGSGEILGRPVQSTVKEGAILRRANFLARSAPPDLKKLIPDGRVLYALNISNQTLPLSGIAQGGSVDIVVAGPSSENQTLRIANVIVRDAQVVGYTAPIDNAEGGDDNKGPLGVDLSPPQLGDDEESPNWILMIAVLPEDVVPLAEADGSGLHLSVVLHGSLEEDAERLTVKNRQRIELIQGAGSKHVQLP